MTFFYDLNKKLDTIREKPETTNKQLNERDMSRAAKGYEKYGKEGMEALAKAGREGKDLDPVRKKYDKYDESMDEGALGSIVQKLGGAAKKAGGAVMNKLGHGSDADMMRDLQKKMGVAQTGEKPKQPPVSEEGGIPMTPKQKKFAKLAPPADKITFADKIVGAKKEVDEVLGQVAADAMKKAVSGHGTNKKKPTDEGWDEMEKDVKSRIGQMKTGEKKKTSKGEVEKTATGIRHTRSYDAKTGETDTGDDGEGQQQKRGRGRPKGPAKGPERVTAKATKHKGGRKTNEGAAGAAQQIYDELADIRAVAKQAQGGGAFPQGFASRLENSIWSAMQLIQNQQGAGAQVREEELDEKAVSKAQQKFMGMAHAMQKGEKIPGASKELKKVAKTMKKGDVEDFAKTKHKGLPEKVKSKKKEKDVEESSVGGTTAGSVAPAASSKGKGGMTFGKGIYDSMNREVEAMIAESMNISMNMNSDEHGGPSKSLTVTATDEDAVYLGKLLKMAGVGSSEGRCGCGSEPCSCDVGEELDENSPDWPTNTETSDDALQYSGGVNGPKSTGQAVGAPFNRQAARQGAGVLENSEVDDIKNLAGIQETKKVEEDDVEEGNKFTGNLAKARAAGKTEADLDGDGDLEKVRESISNLWKTYRG